MLRHSYFPPFPRFKPLGICISSVESMKLLRQLHNEGFRGSAVGRTLVSFLSPARYTAWSGCAG
ncbi:hypothetical protein BC834DRAFT_913740 [Gloeopeniophorella convolvens]|nr:hypothetical protein BC834DRAFT_913740 [Gloeopeniophorella convolvens]